MSRISHGKYSEICLNLNKNICDSNMQAQDMEKELSVICIYVYKYERKIMLNNTSICHPLPSHSPPSTSVQLR